MAGRFYTGSKRISNLSSEEDFMANKNHLILKRASGIILLLLCLVGFEGKSQNEPTEILWDTYGVPHIFGNSEQDMYYAYGWAQMHNHADLILKLYGQARGKAAEYWGESFLESDRQIGLYEVPAYAEQNYNNQKEPYKSYLEAFIRGMNDYALANTGAISEKFRQVLPVSGKDVMAHVIRILCLEFIAGEDIYTTRQAVGKGSNAIAISPARSASGNAMLLTNPHLPWSDFFLWFEAHLECKGFKAYGITLVGSPTLTMAFNDHLGWAFTVNTMDGADRYELTLKDGGYLWNGKIKPFEKKEQVIKILQKNGSIKEMKVEHHYSVHGPVAGVKGDKGYAIRMVGLKNSKIFEEFHKMAAATNLREFEAALKMMQNPMFNILYSGTDGNIMYLFNGNIPKRPSGDFRYWRGAIDGTKSKYLWNSILDYKDLPKVINPPAGFVQNCNDAPWVCTYPPVLQPSDYPAWLAPQSMLLRPQRSVNMILDHPRISFEQLIELKMNTGVEAAYRFLDDLLKAVDLYPDTLALKAAAVLKSWDRKTDAGSKGAVLFTRWFDKLPYTSIETQWTPTHPITTPDGLKDPKLAVELLIKAAAETQQKYGAMDVAWGTVYRFRMNGLDLPANGGPGEYGIFRTIGYTDDPDSKKRAFFGDSYVAAIEFSNPVKAMVSLSYGNATQPGSKHIGDQLELISEKKLRPALLSREDILRNLEKREVLTGDNFK
jgi:acyl-homoserine-lactone acylase